MDEVFAHIPVEEPTLEDTHFIIQKVAEDLEIEYEVQIEPSARESTVNLTRRFGGGQAFPGKAIELLEESAILAATQAGAALPLIDHSAVAACFAQRTGLSRLLVDDTIPLDEEEVRRVFRRRVIGQEQAVDAIIQTLSLVKARLNDPRRPLGVFLFLGPTGVGKTELAKTLAAICCASYRARNLNSCSPSRGIPLKSLLRSYADLPPVELCAAVFAGLALPKGDAEQYDDMAMLVVEAE